MLQQVRKIFEAKRTYVVIMILLIFEVVFLILKNRELHDRIESLERRISIKPLAVGDTVREFGATSLAGEPIHIDYSGDTKQRLFFIFSTSCPYCEDNVLLWNVVTRRIDTSRTILRGISIHPLNRTLRWVERNKPAFGVLVTTDTAFYKSYRIAGVPVTLLVSDYGRVVKPWRGELTELQFNELMDSLSLSRAQ